MGYLGPQDSLPQVLRGAEGAEGALVAEAFVLLAAGACSRAALRYLRAWNLRRTLYALDILDPLAEEAGREEMRRDGVLGHGDLQVRHLQDWEPQMLSKKEEMMKEEARRHRAVADAMRSVEEAEEALREDEERRRREALKDSDLRFWEPSWEIDTEQLELFTEKKCEVMSDEEGLIGVFPCGEGEWEYRV